MTGMLVVPMYGLVCRLTGGWMGGRARWVGRRGDEQMCVCMGGWMGDRSDAWADDGGLAGRIDEWVGGHMDGGRIWAGAVWVRRMRAGAVA